jgi:hypothetical protein
MDCLAFPIKFDPYGLVKLEDGTYDYFKQLLTVSLLTEPGEHPLTPDYGVLDSTFMPVEPSDFILNAAKYVPEVEIVEINPLYTESTGALSVEFSFRIIGD